MAPYFSVHPIKLALLSLCSFAIYDFYWFLKNFQTQKIRGKNISPKWRAGMAPFYAFGLFKDIVIDANSYEISIRYHPYLWAFIFFFLIVVAVLIKISYPFSLIVHLHFLPIYVMNSLCSKVNKAADHSHRDNSSFGFVAILCTLIGGSILVLNTAGHSQTVSNWANAYLEKSPYGESLLISEELKKRLSH